MLQNQGTFSHQPSGITSIDRIKSITIRTKGNDVEHELRTWACSPTKECEEK